MNSEEARGLPMWEENAVQLDNTLAALDEMSGRLVPAAADGMFVPRSMGYFDREAVAKAMEEIP